jgi:hypothetical protein
MNGYSFNLPGYVDAAGEPIWLPASKLDRRLSWSQLERTLTGPSPDRLASEETVPRKRLERPASWEERRREVGAEQFTAARWEQARAVVGEMAGQIRAEQSANTKWKQVSQALTSQNEAEKQAAEAARVASAVMGGHPRQVRDMLAAQEQRRKPWTPEQKRQYATAKAQAERAAKAKDAAKWTEVAGGGYQRDVRGMNLRLWVSEDGAWSITSKKDPDRQYAAGQSDTVAQAQAAAAAKAKTQAQAMWKQVPVDKRTESATRAVRRVIADLTPTKPADVPIPKRRSIPAMPPPAQGYQQPGRDQDRDSGLGR